MQTPFFSLVLFSCFTIACTSVKKTENSNAMKKDSFTVLTARAQDWTAGIPSGGSGTEYYFEVKINTSKPLTFDSAWIDNKSFGIFLSRESAAISTDPVQFIQGDTITLRVSDLNLPNSMDTPSKPPIGYAGAALIGYTLKGKPLYFTITEIEKLPSLKRQ